MFDTFVSEIHSDESTLCYLYSDEVNGNEEKGI